jgi:hypothetical protein
MNSVLTDLNTSLFTQVYTGKQGCACGCGGNYFTEQRDFRRVLNLLRKRESEGNNIEVMEGFRGEFIVSYEGENRASRIYTTQTLTEWVNVS